MEKQTDFDFDDLAKFHRAEPPRRVYGVVYALTGKLA
jgi:hypothetical protein